MSCSPWCMSLRYWESCKASWGTTEMALPSTSATSNRSWMAATYIHPYIHALTLQKPWIPKILASATCLFILFLRFSKSARLLLYLSKYSAFFSSSSAILSCSAASASESSGAASSVLASSSFLLEKKFLLRGSRQTARGTRRSSGLEGHNYETSRIKETLISLEACG